MSHPKKLFFKNTKNYFQNYLKNINEAKYKTMAYYSSLSLYINIYKKVLVNPTLCKYKNI